MPEGRERKKLQEALFDEILNWLAKRVGSESYYKAEEPGSLIARELFERFGVYNAKGLYERWQKLKQKPDSLRNRTLRQIANAAKADEVHFYDESFLNAILSSHDPAWVPAEKLAEELDATEDFQRQKQLLVRLQAELIKLIRLRKLTGYIDHEERPLTLQDFERGSPLVHFQGGTQGDVPHITAPMQRAGFNIRFEESAGKIDREKLAADTLLYGAKGANLRVLAKVQKTFNKGLNMWEADFEIPKYRLIPVKIYEQAQAGEKIMPEIENIYKWAKDRKVIVRSSAVFSEDSEDSTGAGIYDSIILEKGATPRQFLTVIKNIYTSVDSPRALAYRKERGIAKEKMGLVVQEFVESSPSERGYANTVMNNVPELLEIVYEDGIRPLIIKEKAVEALATDNTHDAPIMHYEIDWSKKSPHDLKRLGFLFTLLERHYGQGIQIEFLRAKDKDGIPTSFIVQARFLPKSFSEKRKVEFPDEPSVFEGRAVGAFDMTLPILDNKRDNTDEEGVVIFQSSEFATEFYGTERAIPKSGAVMVLGVSDGKGGHIETLCAEKGIALVCSAQEGNRRMGVHEKMLRIQMGFKQGVEVPYDSFGGYKTLRLIGDGLEGRVYGRGERMKEED